MSERKQWVRCKECGKTAKRDLVTEAGGFKATPGNWATPHKSYAMASPVDSPAEAHEEEKHIFRMTGEKVRVDPKDGGVYTNSLAQQGRVARGLGMRQLDRFN